MKKIYLLSFIALWQFVQVNAQNTDWQFHSYYHDPFNEDKAYGVTPTSDGGFVYVGKYGTNGNGNADIYVSKLNSSDMTVWTKIYSDSLGDEGRSIKELSDGSFIVSGFTFRMGDTTGASSYKNLLMKLDSNGDSLWTRQFKSSGVALGDGFGGCVEKTFDGGFVLVGKFPNGGNGNDFCLAKANANGDSVWTKLYGSTGSDIARSVVQTADSGFIISGTTKSYGPNAATGNMWLIKTNSTGNTMWTKVIGSANEEECFMARPTMDGGYILAGRTGNNSTSSSDLFVVKTDANGDSLWSKTFGNPIDNDFGRDIVQTADHGYALIGSRVATHGYSLLFPQLMYVVKMDSMGTKQWDKELGYDGSPNGANGLSIANTPDGGLVAAGFNQVDSLAGVEDIRAFVVKFSPLPTAIPSLLKETVAGSLVYPNPFNETATISIPAKMTGSATLDIYNATGQKVMSRNIDGGITNVTISKKELSLGMYFYELHSVKDDARFRGKFIAE